MKFYVGVTDIGWFTYLSRINPEDINFWQPGGSTSFKVLARGAPFLFKLKSPLNVIGGVCFFSSHTFLPLSVAWDTFEQRNGCGTYGELRDKIFGYRKTGTEPNPTIGCIVLTSPVFFRKEDWIPVPTNWARSIVQGKSYITEETEGNQLWNRVREVLLKYEANRLQPKPGEQLVVEPDAPQYNSVLAKVRVGQGAFRVLVIDGYQRRCSISGERTLPVLEAAHIKPYAHSGPNALSNGILLRSDMHKLFDAGYLTVTKDLNVEVSSRISQEFQNGKEYYKFHGQKLLYLPSNQVEQPNTSFLEWHNSNCYKG